MIEINELATWLGDPNVRLVLAALGGTIVGFGLGRAATRLRRREVERLARHLFDASEDRHRMATEAMFERVRASIGDLSLDALTQTSTQLLDLADTRLGAERERQTAALDQRKALIDQELGRVGQELERLRTLVGGLERARARSMGGVAERLDAAGRATQELARTTQSLKAALSSAPRRGQWGERLADDLLRQAGLVEGVSFVRQTAIEGGGRPDFTFLLPNDVRLHMDVKFPLDNYLRLAAAHDATERTRLERAFLQDVRGKVKELAGRRYAESPGALDYVLLFIPNEPVAAYVFERRPELVDEALDARVVPCSPASLVAVLAVVRRAVEHFLLTETADELIAQMRSFRGEWDAFKTELARLGKRLEDAQATFDSLAGPRSRALERPLRRLDPAAAQSGSVADDLGDRTGDG